MILNLPRITTNAAMFFRMILCKPDGMACISHPCENLKFHTRRLMSCGRHKCKISEKQSSFTLVSHNKPEKPELLSPYPKPPNLSLSYPTPKIITAKKTTPSRSQT
ncbi:hypothetical protein M758_5G082800 [Ceratodon purpureus]|nr:hypothetical protein M758_5G082800 [Ceratodon purpureus]